MISVFKVKVTSKSSYKKDLFDFLFKMYNIGLFWSVCNVLELFLGVAFMEPRKDKRADRSNGEGHRRHSGSDEMHSRGDFMYTRLGHSQTKHGLSFVDVGESNKSTSTSETAYLPHVFELRRN